jgi:hypothetical protein
MSKATKITLAIFISLMMVPTIFDVWLVKMVHHKFEVVVQDNA